MVNICIKLDAGKDNFLVLRDIFLLRRKKLSSRRSGGDIGDGKGRGTRERLDGRLFATTP